MPTTRAAFGFLFAILVVPAVLFAQESSPCEKGKTPTVQNGRPGFIDNCTKAFTPLKAATPKTSLAEEVQPVQAQVPASVPTDKDALRVRVSQADYAVWENDFKRRTYENQLVQTRIIFAVVLVLVAAGLFFSWIQFQHSFHIRATRKRRGSHEAGGGTEPAGERIELGKSGIVIQSAYLGVIILAISMAFFFLYLKFVYPIS
jgi:hypothetical protein